MPTTSARLLALLSLLQVRRDWPGALLAERLDVSARTVRRDVDRLRDLGYPIASYKGPDGGYRLEAGTDLPPLLFDDEQAVALAIGLTLATTSGVGIEDAAARALNTVRQVMPARLRHRIDTLRIAAVEARPDRPEIQVGIDVLTALAAAVHAREVLRFDYAAVTAKGAGTIDIPRRPRIVEPHHLVTQGSRWYLIAWDLDRTDWRIFRADRITPRIPTGPRFTPRELPGGSVSTFVAGRYRGSDSGEWPCRGEVILRLPAAYVSRYADRDGIVEELGPDRCKLTLGSWSWAGLAAAIGRFDADIEVVGPAELADAFAELARRYAAAGQCADVAGADLTPARRPRESPRPARPASGAGP
ncbi:helix-turn-helix transcriptional regulator [Nocardia sp. NPDC059180]|uniref:helix-turn-helix transcriptional regulator n=1 Tax=Nocardia sp. NPDC059180 TaxID=3346761 RepID=UPI0036A4F48C